MKEMTIKIIANFIHKGKNKQLTEEVKYVLTNTPQKKDTTKLSNFIKKLFEDELNRTVVVKLRINKESIIAKVQIRSTPEEEKG